MEQELKRQRKPKFQSPTGMHDVFGEDQRYFQKIIRVVENIADFYAFQKIDVPVVEEAEIFSRGVGANTDIVEKEMYVFRTKGGDYLSLRPEFTAGVVRAYIEHGMFNFPQPQKFWYFGPAFRYERPQAGRYRQFHHLGFEVLGEKSPIIDAQVIQIAYNVLQGLGLKNLLIEINSIGDSLCRPYYKKLLVSYLKSRENLLCADCRRRLRANPLRVLDCKQEKCQKITSHAPQLIDHLCQDCHNHLREVLEFLDELELPYRLNPYLVRGLDYYTKTVFEIIEDSNEGRTQGTLSAGGRYDGLVKLLGGKETPACGYAAGVERIVNLMKAKGINPPPIQPARVYLAQLGGLARKKSLKLLEDFRKSHILISESLGKDSLKTQLRIADKLGADYVLILGQKEALEKTIIIRKMDTGKQDTVKIEKVVDEIKKRLKK